MWGIFRRHHYLSAEFNKAADFYLIYWNDTLVGMMSVLPMPSGLIKNAFRVHRTVILPDFQSLGIGTKVLDWFGNYYIHQGKKFYIKSTHIRLARHCRKNREWFENSHSQKQITKAYGEQHIWKCILNRPAYTFEYRGIDWATKPPKTIVVDTDYPPREYLEALKKQYYLTVATGVHGQINKTEKDCLSLGIPTYLLYWKKSGEITKIKKYENMEVYKTSDISTVKKSTMNIYIYDCEVFKDDWLIVFRNPDSDHHIVIHNDAYKLRAFLDQPDIVIGGFNTKHYDDYILLTILGGGTTDDVKKCNDWIISGKEPWTFPFNQFKKKTFRSFDLRDDIPDKGLSLKAVEGNLYLPIVESSVPFDLDRPLTDKELEETIFYCKSDVDATIQLYKKRKADYIDAKILIAEMYNIPVEEALGMTNAKLAARLLGAKMVQRSDEREYVIPPQIDLTKIPDPVYKFFDLIHDKTISDLELFGRTKPPKVEGKTLELIFNGCPVKYAWGGLHGAKERITVVADGDYLIVNFDVSSLYPNSMLNFGYVSRNTDDPDAFKRLVEKRLSYKHSGDKLRSGALKLPINTTYGAMLNRFNDLCDPWAGRSVCITNQLAVTMLIVDLARTCSTIDFININTDGVMYKIHKSEDKLAADCVASWCDQTGFEMERDDFSKVIQKDVNNYIGVKTDGHVKTKGGFVSLCNGGSFKTNSLVIVHKAIVDYLLHDVPVEDTINNATNIFDFQMIVKTGGTFEGSYHFIDGKAEPIQKVNRVYAAKDPRYGQIAKRKIVTEKRSKGQVIKLDPPVERWNTVADCPDHAIIDNENRFTLADIDKAYYIQKAKERIKQYLEPNKKGRGNKNVEVINIMANTTKATEGAQALNIYQKLAEARAQFLAAPKKKSGVNRFAEFKYFELSDIVPTATYIFGNLGLTFLVSFDTMTATGTLVNCDKPDETIVFTSPMVPLTVIDKSGEAKSPAGMNSVQALGGSETYQRRYLYMLALDIVEADTFDAGSGKPDPETPKAAAPAKNNRPATPEKREEVKKDLTGGDADETQIKAIKAGLKKLKAKDLDKYGDYINASVQAIKGGLDKKAAEDMLIEIGNKVEE